MEHLIEIQISKENAFFLNLVKPFLVIAFFTIFAFAFRLPLRCISCMLNVIATINIEACG